MKRRLITCALPYVNNIPHLGNLLQVLSADVFARFCRSKGYETLYVCGTDEYGTATETRASQKGVSPKELCDYYHVIHKQIYEWFNIKFDYFGRTSTPQQTEIVQRIFKEVDKAGYITEKETEQLYCPSCQRFLADRFVEGTCPHCLSPDARGDQCDSCQKVLDPTELLNPRCSVCKTTPVIKKTKHLYIDLPKALPLLQSWIDKASVKGFWSNNAIAVTQGWIRDGLKERCITRDLKWGIPVPKPGYENKVFYVWFDAPIGYISITSCARPDEWEQWWHDQENTELFQFIGKDNIPFHTVIFPATQLCSGEKWTMLHHMSSTEYLNYEGGKFSKSQGIGVFGNDIMSTGIPADIWRFYLLYNRPEHGDVDFTWNEFKTKVNGELVGNLSNLVNRVLTFVKRYYEGSFNSQDTDSDIVSNIKQEEERITDLLERAEERSAFKAIFELADYGNKVFQESEPWKLRISEPEKAEKILRTLVFLIRDLGILISPFMPCAGEKILSMLNCNDKKWTDLGIYDGFELKEVSYLFTKLDDKFVEDLKMRFSGKQEETEKKEQSMQNETTEEKSISERFAEKVILKVSKIVGIERHPQGDFLYILKLDTGEEEQRTIVSSIVPYYREEELLNHNIVLVSNLKPANFRGVKSCGMLLAASDPAAPEHSTCEVLFADDIPVGSNLVPKGLSNPQTQMSYVKPDHFFDMPLYTENGVLCIDGREIVSDKGNTIVAKRYLNGNVG